MFRVLLKWRIGMIDFEFPRINLYQSEVKDIYMGPAMILKAYKDSFNVNFYLFKIASFHIFISG